MRERGWGGGGGGGQSGPWSGRERSAGNRADFCVCCRTRVSQIPPNPSHRPALVTADNTHTHTHTHTLQDNPDQLQRVKMMGGGCYVLWRLEGCRAGIGCFKPFVCVYSIKQGHAVDCLSYQRQYIPELFFLLLFLSSPWKHRMQPLQFSCSEKKDKINCICLYAPWQQFFLLRFDKKHNWIYCAALIEHRH